MQIRFVVSKREFLRKNSNYVLGLGTSFHCSLKYHHKVQNLFVIPIGHIKITKGCVFYDGSCSCSLRKSVWSVLL